MKNNVFKIWKNRIRYIFKQYLKLISLFRDVVLFIYVFIPAVAFTAYYYVKWLDNLPAYLDNMFVGMAALIIWVIFVISGGYRTYLVSADKSFLIPIGYPVYRFVYFSKIFSLFLDIIKMSFALLVLFPILHNLFDVDWLEFFILLLLGVFIKISVYNLKWILLNLNKKLILTIINYLSLIIFIVLIYFYVQVHIAIYNFLIWSICILLSLISSVIASNVNIYWDSIIDREITQRAMLIFSTLQNTSGIKKVSRKKASIFTRGHIIFPFDAAGAIASLYLKSFIRQWENISLFVQIIIISILLITNIHVFMVKLISLFIVLSITCMFLKSIYLQFKRDLWPNIWPIKYEQRIRGIRMGPKILFFIHALAMYTVLLYEHLGLWAVVAAAMLAYISCHVYVNILFWEVEAIIFNND